MILSKNISFYVLLGAIVFAAFFTYQVLSAFLIPMFLAAILVVMFRPLHDWIVIKCKGRIRLAAILTTMIILTIVLLPLVTVFSMAIKETIDLVRSDDKPVVVERLKEIRSQFDLDIPDVELYQQIVQRIENLGSISPGSRTVATTQTLINDLQSLLDDYDGAIHAEQSSKLETLLQPEGGADMATLLISLKDRDFEEMLLVIDTSTSLVSQKGQLQKLVQQFQKLNTGMIKVKELLIQTEEELEKDKLVPGDLIFLSHIHELKATFDQSIVEYFGGQPWATLKIYANPGQREANRLKAMAIESLEEIVLPVTGAGASFAGGTILGIGILIICLYYFLVDGPSLVSSAMHMSPLDDEYESQLVEEFASVSRAVVVATLLSAVVQGFLAGIGFWLCGLESIFLLIFLTMALSMIPFFGAASVWVPVCLWLFFVEDRFWAATFIAIYGAGIVSMADNVIKPLVLHGQSKLHPLLALLSVLGGVKALGPIGILIGPMMVSFLQALLNILQSELAKMDKMSQAGNGEATEKGKNK
ncbi:MAG: AI-2E family transporter [Pirellulales bacterium]